MMSGTSKPPRRPAVKKNKLTAKKKAPVGREKYQAVLATGPGMFWYDLHTEQALVISDLIIVNTGMAGNYTQIIDVGVKDKVIAVSGMMVDTGDELVLEAT